MTPALAVAILALPHDPGSEIMRAVLFHAAQKQSVKDWREFLRRVRVLGPPAQAEELAPGVWLLPLPDCQGFLDALTQILQRPLPFASSRTREVDCIGPWRTLT